MVNKIAWTSKAPENKTYLSPYTEELKKYNLVIKDILEKNKKNGDELNIFRFFLETTIAEKYGITNRENFEIIRNIFSEKNLDFLEFFTNKNSNLINNTDYSVFKLFFGEQGFIKDKISLDKLIEIDNNLHRLKEIIENFSKNELIKSLHKNGLFINFEDLFLLIEKKELGYILMYNNTKKVNIFFSSNNWFKISDFKKLENDLIRDLYYFTMIEYEDDGSDDIDEKLEKNVLNNLKYFFGNNGKFNSKEKFLELRKSKNWSHLKILIKYGTIEQIEKILNEEFNDFLDYDGEIIDIKNIKGTCGLNEEINEEILNGEKKDYILVLLNNEIIGIFKTYGEKTFLSFKNIKNRDGKILFLEKMIYYLKVDKEKLIEKKKSIILSGKTLRNPLRLSKLDNFEELVQKFLKSKK